MSKTQVTPEVLWAQRSSSTEAAKNVIYLTISVPDVPADQLKVDLKPTSLSFDGHSSSKNTDYHVDLEFYAEIDVENSKTNHTNKQVEFVLRKKELKEEYWPRLLKESKKVHFLKTDFDKWVDEDEQDEVPEEAADLGGMPPGGMGGMGGGDGGFGGIDFSKLGGGAGGMGGMDMSALQGMAGGMGGMDMSALAGMGGAGGEGGEEEDDEDMPELEEAGASKTETGGDAETKAAPKIEEVS